MLIEKRVLREIFGTQREDMTRLHGQELGHWHSLYIFFWRNQIKGVENSWACSMYGEEQRRREEVSGEKTGGKERGRWKRNKMVPM
jgi:hypothetical protein